jgi:hypothetical protein
MPGLDSEGRKEIYDMVTKGRSGETVRKEINKLVFTGKWSYDKNVELVRWLRSKGYGDTANYLSELID